MLLHLCANRRIATQVFYCLFHQVTKQRFILIRDIIIRQ